jgi:chemotaxis protein CheX
VNMTETIAQGGQSVSAEIRETLLGPFIAATRTALAEMASVDVVARTVCQNSSPPAAGDISAVLQLTSATDEWLVLSFPERTAATLARRMLTGVTPEVDDQLIRDCVAEIGNVVAGQAKALLAATPFHFAFSVPKVMVGVNDFQYVAGLDYLVVAFDGVPGEFTLRLYRKP